MHPVLKLTGAKAYQKKLAYISRRLERSVPSLLTQEARALAGEFGSATVPGPGFGQDRLDKFARRVESDIRRVFASAASPFGVYRHLLAHAPDFAAAYWRQHRLQKPRAMAAILRQAGVQQGTPTAAVHRAARTNRGARVPSIRHPGLMVPEPQLRRYIRQRVQRVGMAKAGWYAAGTALGGRMRRTATDDAGIRRSVQIFPASLRAIARREPGIGGAWISGRGINTRVTIANRVRHAGAALPAPLRASALGRAQQRLAAAIAHSLRKTARRRTPAAAAA